MEFAWLYILVALLGAAAAVFLRRAVKQPLTREQIGAWFSIAVGVGFFVIYALKVDRDVSVLAFGLLCALAGAHSLEMSRLHQRIRQLEDEVKASRGADGEPSAKL
jgi:hypothetical protein